MSSCSVDRGVTSSSGMVTGQGAQFVHVRNVGQVAYLHGAVRRFYLAQRQVVLPARERLDEQQRRVLQAAVRRYGYAVGGRAVRFHAAHAADGGAVCPRTRSRLRSRTPPRRLRVAGVGHVQRGGRGAAHVHRRHRHFAATVRRLARSARSRTVAVSSSMSAP